MYRCAFWFASAFFICKEIMNKKGTCYFFEKNFINKKTIADVNSYRERTGKFFLQFGDVFSERI